MEHIPLEDLDQQRRKSHDSMVVHSDQESEVEGSQRSHEENPFEELNFTNKSRFQKIVHGLWHGPETPKDEPPARFNSVLEEIPDKFNAFPKTVRVSILSVYLLLWYLLVHSILTPYFTTPPTSDEGVPVVTLGCTDQLWRGKNAACGLDGEECFPGMEEVYVRCPALCDRSWTYSFEPIGSENVKYRGYFIGGGADLSEDGKSLPYRADSYICGSAVHAGLVSPFRGGCARVSYSSGAQAGFESAKGHYGVDDSLEFKSFFPYSFFFKSLQGKFHQCYDPRFPVLITNIVLGLPIMYLASGGVVFWVINTVGFWTIAMATDPPVNVDSSDAETYASLVSITLERFLPSCFILYALWSCSTKVTFTAPQDYEISYLKRVIYFYPLFWLGVLNNVSFDRLPVDRFTLHDLKEQPGGAIAVSCIVLSVATCAIIQAYKIWEAGKFKKYLVIYLLFLLGLVTISQLPGLTLRVHHYILAMLLIPGCCTRGSTALLFQGILLGLFLSGAAKWGLASIAETATSLRRNDPSGKILPPQILDFNFASGILTWNDTLVEKFNGVSILVNDVERYVGPNNGSINFKTIWDNLPALTTMLQESLRSKYAKDNTIPVFVRIGRKLLGTNKYSDFSNAMVLTWPQGSVKLPKPGVT